MPELPEVETVVRDLNKKVVGRRIVGAWFDWPKMIKDPLDQSRTKIAHKHVVEFEKAVVGSKIVVAKRRAKNILIYLFNKNYSPSLPVPRLAGRGSRGNSANLLLLIHQKMTGHMLIGKWRIKCQVSGVRCQAIPIEPRPVVNDPQNRFIHLIFYLDNGKMLALSDLRKFAKVILGRREEIENLPELVNLGPDALDPSLKFIKFVKLIKSEKRKIKQVLMDQEVIAGIGNIYSDDILWTARVHPFRPANKLKEVELKAIYNAMRKILKIAVKLRGTSVSDFRDTNGKIGYYGKVRKVYQREDEPCSRCGTKIKRVKISGRSAHYCPKCQFL